MVKKQKDDKKAETSFKVENHIVRKVLLVSDTTSMKKLIIYFGVFMEENFGPDLKKDNFLTFLVTSPSLNKLTIKKEMQDSIISKLSNIYKK